MGEDFSRQTRKIDEGWRKKTVQTAFNGLWILVLKYPLDALCFPASHCRMKTRSAKLRMVDYHFKVFVSFQNCFRIVNSYHAALSSRTLKTDTDVGMIALLYGRKICKR